MNNRIRELRKAKKLTLKQFGQKVGVSEGAVSNIEKGHRNVTEQMIRSICREFNVNEEWLRNGTGDMFIHIDKDEKLEAWADKALKEVNDSFKKRFLRLLSNLSEEEWEFLEQKAKQLAEMEKLESSNSQPPLLSPEDAEYYAGMADEKDNGSGVS